MDVPTLVFSTIISVGIATAIGEWRSRAAEQRALERVERSRRRDIDLKKIGDTGAVERAQLRWLYFRVWGSEAQMELADAVMSSESHADTDVSLLGADTVRFLDLCDELLAAKYTRDGQARALQIYAEAEVILRDRLAAQRARVEAGQPLEAPPTELADALAIRMEQIRKKYEGLPRPADEPSGSAEAGPQR